MSGAPALVSVLALELADGEQVILVNQAARNGQFAAMLLADQAGASPC